MNPDEPITAPSSGLIDAHITPPFSGARVMALNHGGVLVFAIWTSTSINDFDAWAPYPKVPRSVKDRQAARLNLNPPQVKE